MARRKQPSLMIKQGDDFDLPLTVSNVSSSEALALEATLDAAKNSANPDISTITSLMDAYENTIKVDITNWTIKADILWCGRHIATLTTTITDGPDGAFVLSATSAETALWVPRQYESDLQFTVDNKVISSETFLVHVEEDQTHA